MATGGVATVRAACVCGRAPCELPAGGAVRLRGACSGGVGKTSGPETFGTLIDDVEHKLFDRLPDDTWFYPGHGRDSTLGAERPSLAEWRSRGW